MKSIVSTLIKSTFLILDDESFLLVLLLYYLKCVDEHGLNNIQFYTLLVQYWICQSLRETSLLVSGCANYSDILGLSRVSSTARQLAKDPLLFSAISFRFPSHRIQTRFLLIDSHWQARFARTLIFSLIGVCHFWLSSRLDPEKIRIQKKSIYIVSKTEFLQIL